MKNISVKVNGQEWYFGTSAENALDHIIQARSTGETDIDVSRVAPTRPGLKVQCCAGVEFHASDCPFLR